MTFIDRVLERTESYKKLSRELIETRNANASYKDIVDKLKEAQEWQSWESWEFRAGSNGKELPPANAKKFLDAYQGWAYVNISRIAEAVAMMKFHLYRLKVVGGEYEIEEIKEHELLELLNRVNNHMTKYQLLYMSSQHKSMLGEVAWYLVGSTPTGGKPKEIWPLRPDYLSIKPGDLGKDEFIKYYEYKVPGKDPQIFDPHEILFMRVPDPKSMYRGMGVMKAAAIDLDTDSFASEYNKSFFMNSARPDVILTTEQILKPEISKRLSERWYAKYGNVNSKSNGVAVLEQGLKAEPFTLTQKDMDFMNQLKWTRDKIKALFGNTNVAIGITEDINRATAEASERVWLKWTIDPQMRWFVDYLNEFLVPRYGLDLFLGYESPVPEDKEIKLKEYEVGWNKWLTINEIRDELGKAPIGAEGDYIYLPLNLVPAGQGSPEVVPPEKSIKKIKVNPIKIKQFNLKKRYEDAIQRLTVRNYTIRQKMRSIAELTQKILGGISGRPLEYTKIESQETKIAFQKVQLDISDQYSKQIEEHARKFIISEVDTAAINMLTLRKEIGSMLTTKENDEYDYNELFNATNLFGDKKEQIAAFMAIVLPVLYELAKEQGKEATRFLGFDPSEFKEDKKFQKTVQDSIKRTSSSVVKTLRNGTVKFVKQQLDEGKSPDEIAKNLRDKYTNMSKTKARQIAETESVRLTNASTIDAWVQSGIVEAKIWITSVDEKVCGWCQPMDGKVVGITGNFFDKGSTYKSPLTGSEMKLDYEAVDKPPLHVSCRCTLAPQLINSKSAEMERIKNARLKKLDSKNMIRKEVDKYLKQLSEVKDE